MGLSALPCCNEPRREIERASTMGIFFFIWGLVALMWLITADL